MTTQDTFDPSGAYMVNRIFRMEYRRQTGVIEKADDFEFDEDILFETLDAIAEGKMEEL